MGFTTDFGAGGLFVFAAASVLLARCGLAQPVWTFSDNCGNGQWTGACQLPSGLWQNNWGRTAATPAQLEFPGAGDRVEFDGTLSLAGDAATAGFEVPAGSRFDWRFGRLALPTAGDTAALVNRGAVELSFANGGQTEGNGTWFNAPGAEWTFGNANLDDYVRYGMGRIFLINEGLVTLRNGGDLAAYSLPITDPSRFTNGATLRAVNTSGLARTSHFRGMRMNFTPSSTVLVESGSALSIGGLPAISQPDSSWITEPGGTLTIDSDLAGVFTGDHRGRGEVTATAGGGATLRAKTTFTTKPGSLPWVWTRGGIDAREFELVNAGLFEMLGVTGGCGVLGSFVNMTGGDLTVFGRCELFSGSTLINRGRLTLATGATVSPPLSGRSGLPVPVLSNEGTMIVNGPDGGGSQGAVATSILGVSLVAEPGSIIRLEPDARFNCDGFLNRAPIGVGEGQPARAARRLEGFGTILGSSAITVGVGSPTPGAGAFVIAPGTAGQLGILTFSTLRLTLSAQSDLEIDLRIDPGATTLEDAVSLDRIRADAPGREIVLGGTLRIVRAPLDAAPPPGVAEKVLIDNVRAPTGNLSEFDVVIDENPLPGISYKVRMADSAVLLRVTSRCTAADIASAGQTAQSDGALTADDIIVYLNWFFAGDVRADIAGPGQSSTPDGALSADDIVVFLDRFFAGC